MNKIKILVVDDMKAHRNRIKRIAKKTENLEVIAEAENGYEAILKALQIKPDIILMDIEMEGETSGIMAAKEISKHIPDIKIIMLTSHLEDDMIHSSFQEGVSDYLSKEVSEEDLVNSIIRVSNDKVYFNPVVSQSVKKEFKKLRNQEEHYVFLLKLISSLTSSELDILKLLLEGKKRDEISKIRFVEIGSLKKQITSLLKKCKKASTRELIKDLKDKNLIDFIYKI